MIKREFLEQRLRNSEANMAALLSLQNSINDFDNSAVLKELFLKYPDIDASIIEAAANTDIGEFSEWENAPYNRNPFKPEGLIITTDWGLKLRSKNEAIIAQMLREYGVAFRYEAAFETGEHTLYPDFTIKLRDGRLIYWEHFGMMDSEEYRFHNISKLQEYAENGLIPGNNLIITFSYGSGEIDMREIRDIIENKILAA